MTKNPSQPLPVVQRPTALLALADGSVWPGFGMGAIGERVGEVCFNTAMTGYQEILTDPSYAGQIIAFTFPHIGNVGANAEDVETTTPAALGLAIREPVPEPSNFRAARRLDDWCRTMGLVGISGLDTRRLTRRIRETGAPNGVLAHDPDGAFDIGDLTRKAREWDGLEGMDLVGDVTCAHPHEWTETRWKPGKGYGTLREPRHHVVAVDYGAKRNILRCLADLGCRVTVVPGSATAEEILRRNPDGVFLSNGPGDPSATGSYAVPAIQGVLASGVPTFGICLGHQMLALAIGAKTRKMHHGHHGANHPVRNELTGAVEITSQNHGFVVDADSLPAAASTTHRSLFDGTLAGLAVNGRPVFSVQYHPEASPGPRDSHYLFVKFVEMMEARKRATG